MALTTKRRKPHRVEGIQSKRQPEEKTKSPVLLTSNGRTFSLFLLVMILSFIAYSFFNTSPLRDSSAAEIQEKETAEKQHKANVERLNQDADDDGDIGRNRKDGLFCPPMEVVNSTVINGRRVVIENIYKSPEDGISMYQVDNFLTKEECDGLCTAHLRVIKTFNESGGPLVCFADISSMRKYLKDIGVNRKVSVKDFTEETTCINATFSAILRDKLKYSFSTAFYRGESKFSTTFEERIRQVTGLNTTFGGKFQITSYPQGIGYKQHTDCNLDDTDLRDRYATVLVYLQDVREGGETVFPKIGVSVKPKKGRLLFWVNTKKNGECDPMSIHEAKTVVKGKKYIIQRWYYYKHFHMLGARPMQPEIPTRDQFQPRVSCDLFEEGSCRWYDEWGYDHLNEYNLLKHKLH